MTAAVMNVEDTVNDTVADETDAGVDEIPKTEPSFKVFVDEIDAWARHSLAANGFGDSL